MSTLCCQSKCAQKTFFNKAIILLDIECHFIYGQNRRIQMNIRHSAPFFRRSVPLFRRFVPGQKTSSAGQICLSTGQKG